MTVVRKVTVARAAGDDDLEFVLSDDTKDRYGDVIDPKGWVLSSFRKNPIALFNHDSKFPIGNWQSVRVEGNRLLGKLKLAAEGTSERIDEIIRLVEQGILRAVSVGFQPIEQEPLKDNSGMFFKKQELLETSLVSIPANPSAVQLARSLNVSDDTIALVFGKHADTDGVMRRGVHAGQGAFSPSPRASKMTTPLSKRIEDAQERLVALKDQLTQHLDAIGDEPDDAALTVTDELNQKIASQTRALESLQAAERQLASHTVTIQASDAERGGAIAVSGRRPFALPAKQVKPADHVMRSLVGLLVSKASQGRISPEQAVAQRYGEDGRIEEATQIVLRAAGRAEGVHTFDAITRAATAPADTTTSGWASQLVQTAFADFMELLMPASVYPGLSARGLRLNFGRNGVISIPSRAATPTIAGSFVGQGAPIPVRQGAFASTSLTPKKMAVISTFTREIAEYSTPAIEGLIRNAIQEDTSVALDTVLLDANAATTIRPAGIRNGVTTTTATAGGGFAALVGDIKALIGALIAATNGNVRNPVWIMNPIQALSVALTQNAGGQFPFAQEINNNRLQGFPLIQSATVTAGMVILVDAADYVSTEGDAPRFDVSDQATLHMEDTTPLAIGTAGAPNTVAAPVRSLFQTDSMALRMIMEVNWAFRRTGVVAWTSGVTW